MCTGLEIAALAAGTLGSVVQGQEARKQQEAIVAAQNQQLRAFMDRNNQRSEDATALFETRKEAIQPDAVLATQAEAEDTRGSALDSAAASLPAEAAPTKGSTASIIGKVYESAEAREAEKAKKKRDAMAKTASFGDLLFDQQLGTADIGRKIQSITGLAQSDAALLPALQDLAGAEAAGNNQPGLFGQLLSGIGTGGSYYLGSR